MVAVPDVVVDSFKRYKLETQKVVTWLGETASKCNRHHLPVNSAAKRANRKKPVESTKRVAIRDYVLYRLLNQSWTQSFL